MTIVEGQIETVKTLKESLARSGISRFQSVGDIRRFLANYETEFSQLPGQIEREVEAEISDAKSRLDSLEENYDDLRRETRTNLENQLRELEMDAAHATQKSQKNVLLKVFYFPRVSSLSRKASKLRKNLQKTIDKKTRKARETKIRFESQVNGLVSNKDSLISERTESASSALTRTKETVDSLYPLVAGAIGEAAVVSELEGLSNDFYLINDFSMKFDPPIYNKKDKDRIYSIQIDHLLVAPSGVFLLETKNWSKASVESLDLRSPVKQIQRTSFALFVLLNSGSSANRIRLARHHWGDKKIPIRNVIVMINEKPREQFKHVKVVTLKELTGYVEYFDDVFDNEEVNSLFEYLKGRMSLQS